MKKIHVNFLEPPQKQLNSLLEYYQAGRYVDAEKLSLSITKEFPKHQFAWKVLAVVLKQNGRLNESLIASQKSVQLDPQDAVAHYNLGNILREKGRLEDAEASFKQAITFKPDFAEAHYNLGTSLQKLGRFNEAETSYRKVIALKPDFAEAHNNLGITLQELGRLEDAEASFKQAITFKPDFAKAWSNLYVSLQVFKSQVSSIEDYLPLLDNQVTSEYAQISKSILRYRLNQGNPTTKNSMDEVVRILSSADNILSKNPSMPSTEIIASPTQTNKIAALVHFGRSGTGLLHSLIDGHPEVSTLPSIYFSEFFDYITWKKITASGWEEMVDRFVSTYEVLFDASSTIQVASKGFKFSNNIGLNEGMTAVGEEKNEILSVDKKVFVKELKQLIDCYDRLDQLTFFKLVHSAYNKALNDHNKKNLIFYHIHNPDHYAKLNYLRLAPNTNWLMMVREPIQSCESWIRIKYPDDYINVSNRIFQMLFEVDSDIFQNNNSVGIRLEDLKEQPKKTILALCSWLGIKEEDSLYQMTAQGKKWWGDPTSPDYSKEGMNPFGKTSIKRKLGSVFSENDQYILSTLFYPFNVRFGYADENFEKFKNDLQIIRPMLDQMFDFEKKMVQNKKMNTENFMKSSPYLFLRSGMIERWNTLNKFNTYPKMLTPLKLD